MLEASLSLWLQRRWYAPRAPWLLRPLSGLYRLITALRRAGYRRGWLRSGHPGVPVVVIGNLSVGGTGKTPFTLWLAGALESRGVRVGIVSRGYGGSTRGPAFVTADSDAGQVGDEALLLARRSRARVCVARRRLDAANALAREGCQVILADDGLQHLALRRDLEIVVVDAARGFGNGALLPAGPLREAPGRLATVDLVVVQGDPVPQAVSAHHDAVKMTLQPVGFISLQTGQARPATAFAGQTAHAVAGIGDPARFFRQLAALGVVPVEHPFPDHHRFRPQDLQFGDQRPILMTEKDAVKCRSFADGRMWCLPVDAGLAAPDAGRCLDAVLRLVPGGGRSGA